MWWTVDLTHREQQQQHRDHDTEVTGSCTLNSSSLLLSPSSGGTARSKASKAGRHPGQPCTHLTHPLTPPGPAVHSPAPPFWFTTISGRGLARLPLQTRSPLRHGSVMALRKMLSRGKIDFISFHFVCVPLHGLLRHHCPSDGSCCV